MVTRQKSPSHCVFRVIVPTERKKRLCEEFFNSSKDTVLSVNALLGTKDPLCLFTAAFLSHLAVELLMKTLTIVEKDSYLLSHDLLKLLVHANIRKDEASITNKDRNILGELNRYHRLRYLDEYTELEGIDPDEPPGLGESDIRLAIDFYEGLFAVTKKRCDQYWTNKTE